MSTAAFLLRRIEAIRSVATVAPGWRQQDLEDLVRDAVEAVRERVQFARIEASLIADAQVDLDALRRAIALFSGLDASAFSPPAALGQFDVRQRIARLEDLVASLEGPERLEEMEVGLRLEITGDSGFEWLLCALSDVTVVSDSLERLLTPRFHAFGTKFGWAEADLRVEDVYGALVVEAKVARKPPSSKLIVKWLSQLKSYMDQSPMKQRGALVVFNFSAVPMVAPPQFMQARLLVLPINICSVSPSRVTVRRRPS